MDATEESNQRREEEAEGKDEEEEAKENPDEGAGDFRFLNSVDLRLAMIPGFLEYKEAYHQNP